MLKQSNVCIILTKTKSAILASLIVGAMALPFLIPVQKALADNTVTAGPPSIVYVNGVPNVDIVFSGVPGRLYDVLKATSLVNPTWTVVSTMAALPSGTFEYSEPATGPMAFFKTVENSVLSNLSVPWRWSFLTDSPAGISEQTLGLPLDAYFHVIPNTTSLFPSAYISDFWTESADPFFGEGEGRELILTIEQRNADLLALAPNVSTDPTKRYGLYRAALTSHLFTLHDESAPMSTPPPGAVYYVSLVLRGWSYWQVFEGNTTTFTTDVAVNFLTWTGSLNAFKSTYGLTGTEGGRGLVPNSGDIVPHGADAVPANFTMQGPDNVIAVVYKQIPNTTTVDGSIPW